MLSPKAGLPAPVCRVTVEPHVHQAAHLALTRRGLPGCDSPDHTDFTLWLERMSRLLAHNIAGGRLAYASRLRTAPASTLQDYADRVSERLLAEWDRVEALRTGDAREWAAVMERLERIAYYWLGPGGRAAWAAGEAREVTAITCADLWGWLQQHPFPFDVAFDRWAVQALRNRLLAATRARRAQGRCVVRSLDQPFCGDGPALVDLPAGDNVRDWLDREANREWLRHALAQLDPRHAQIVRLWYLEGWPAEKIAQALGMQVGNVYVLKHRAIRRLRSHQPGMQG